MNTTCLEKINKKYFSGIYLDLMLFIRRMSNVQIYVQIFKSAVDPPLYGHLFGPLSQQVELISIRGHPCECSTL